MALTARASRWLELFEAADVLAQIRVARPLLVELLRPQTLFNHAFLDVVGRWPQVAPSAADLNRECDHLEQLAQGAAEVPASHRAGLKGRAVTLVKQLALPALELALRRWLSEQRALNLDRVRALRGKSAAAVRPVQVPLFDAQARFDTLLSAALPDILRIDSYQAAYRAWCEEVEPTLPKPVGPSSAKVSIVCEGSPSPQSLSALLAQRGTWDCLFAEGPTPKDKRFRVGGIAAATGDWVLWVSKDAVLAPEALSHFQAAAGYDFNLAYADDDVRGADGVRRDPFFKPGFCRELASECDLLGGAVWARRSAIHGAHPLDWALALPSGRVRHIAAVLSHRAAPAPTFPRVRRAVPEGALVSVVVPFRDKAPLLRQLFASVERCKPGVATEWLLVDNGSVERQTRQLLEELQARVKAQVLRDPGPFNFSRLNNLAAKHARGSHLLFLNNDVEAASDGWLSVLMEYASLPDVGVVGANLWYPDGTLQHAGVAIGVKGLAGHVFARHHEKLGATPFGSPFHTRTVSAVTGACLLIRRELFEQVGGFDEALPVSGGDVELCLRVGATGARVLNVPHVRLIHHESLSRGSRALSPENLAHERAAYAKLLRDGDPFYHPQLTHLFTSCAPNLEGVTGLR